MRRGARDDAAIPSWVARGTYEVPGRTSEAPDKAPGDQAEAPGKATLTGGLPEAAADDLKVPVGATARA